MSLKPKDIQPVPEKTKQVAKAAFPKGNLYIKMRDELGTFFSDKDFENIYPKRGKPALEPWKLALVTVMQFVENLSDRQAAEAVRARIDWKYALSLELEDSGFDFSVLSEFRARLIEKEAGYLLLDKMLEVFTQKNLVKARGKQRTDSTHVLASIRSMNRFEIITETMRATLNDLATVAPEWLKSVALPEWKQRYAHRAEHTRLPQTEKGRAEYALQVGLDGVLLLELLEKQKLEAKNQPNIPPDQQKPVLRERDSVQTLEAMWKRHFAYSEKGELVWRDEKELPRAATAIESPYDTEAKHSNKHALSWTGYKVHLTETCDPELPHLVTQVHTTVATTQDVSCTEEIQQSLADKCLLPSRHLVDCGYVDADLVLGSKQKHGVELFGPARYNRSWQAREGGYESSLFKVNWETEKVTCPEGKLSMWWNREKVKGYLHPYVRVRFSRKDCIACPNRSKCVRSKTGLARAVLFPDREQYELLSDLRTQLNNDVGRKEYQKRAGIEGTLSSGIRRCGLRNARYRGLVKTHLQHLASGAAMNLVRAVSHLQGKIPESTRVSRFVQILA
jgi:transposase